MTPTLETGVNAQNIDKTLADEITTRLAQTFRSAELRTAQDSVYLGDSPNSKIVTDKAVASLVDALNVIRYGNPLTLTSPTVSPRRESARAHSVPKMRKKRVGHPCSPETRAKISETRKRQWAERRSSLEPSVEPATTAE